MFRSTSYLCRTTRCSRRISTVVAFIWILLFPGLLISQTTQTAQTTISSEKPLVLMHVTIIDIKIGTSNADMAVIVEGNHIATVGKSQKVIVPPNAHIIDASGKFLIPGLWDMHAHTLTDSRYQISFPLLIANGVTGVREMGNNLPPETVNQLREDVFSGKLLGPRFGALTYKILDGAGTHQYVALEVTNPEQARQLVRTYQQQGADFIKPYNLLSREVYLAMIDEARRVKIPLEGHVPFSMTAAEASDSGQLTIEHNFGVLVSTSKDENELRNQTLLNPELWGQFEAKAAATHSEDKAQKLYATFVRNGTWSCPTIAFYRIPILDTDDSAAMNSDLMKYIPKALRDRWHTTFQKFSANITLPEFRKIHYEMRSKIVGEMHRAGVRLLAGTDTGAMYAVPGFSLHDELQALVEAGLSPLEALRTATINPAQFLGKEKEIGTIEPGKIADLVLLERNPLQNISNTRRIAATILNGRYLPKQSLQELLKQADASAQK